MEPKIPVKGFPICIFFFLSLTMLSGREYGGSSSIIEPPLFTKEAWTVGIAVFEGESTDSTTFATTPIASLMGRLLKEQLYGAEEHRISETEREALAEASLDEAELDVLKSLAALHKRRDSIFFSINGNPDERAVLDGQIDREEVKLAGIRALTPADIEIPVQLPVSYPAPLGGGAFWVTGTTKPDLYRQRAGLDLLISGNVLRVGDYYGIQVTAHREEGSTVIWEGAAGEGDLELVSREAGAAIRTLVLGREWAALTISTNPPSATITVDGQVSGVGYWVNSALMPGSLTVKITAGGFAPQILNFYLDPGAWEEAEVVLEPVKRAQTLVSSIPTGADVRLGSLWMGLTPLVIDIPDNVMPLSFELEGFRSRMVPFAPETERLTVPLTRIVGNPAEKLADTRKKLYNSIAWFSFSMAPTIILLGVSQNYMYKNFNSSTPEDYSSSYDAYNLSYGLMWGSIAVNVGLLINVLFKLNRYLKAAEDSSP